MERKKNPKKRYLVMRGNNKICETWATTPGRAIANAWWKCYKQGDKYRLVDVPKEELDAVEID